MSFKNYILEDWVKGILAHPVTKETIQLKAIASKGKIPDATVFLKNTKGWFEWVEGQSQFERWLRKGEYNSEIWKPTFLDSACASHSPFSNIHCFLLSGIIAPQCLHDSEAVGCCRTRRRSA